MAFFISRILDPMWIIPAVTMLKAYKHGFFFTLALLIVMLGIPLVLRLLYRKHDWDISKREDRPKVITTLLILGFTTIILARIFGNRATMKVLIFYEIWLSGFLLISLFWKISGHAGAIALAGGLVILWFGWTWWPVLLLVPLTGWARVATKDHTIGQVIVATLYSWALVIFFGFIS